MNIGIITAKSIKPTEKVKNIISIGSTKDLILCNLSLTLSLGISATSTSTILNNADLDSLKEITTPKKRKGMTDSQLARAKAMLASGYYTQADVAEQFGISPSTLRKYLD